MSYRPLDLSTILATIPSPADRSESFSSVRSFSRGVAADANSEAGDIPARETQPMTPDATAGQPAWAAWWRHSVGSHVASGVPMATAERRTWNKALVLWHGHYKRAPEPGRCAGCDDPVAPSEALLLSDGASLHRDGPRAPDCLAAYSRRWRTRAAAGLAGLSIHKPKGARDD